MTIETTVPKREKLTGYEFYRKVLGSPKYIVAPMVDQSELAFRTLTRRYGAQLIYTPMINAKMFADTTHKYYREQYFDIANGEEGSSSLASSSTSGSSSTPKPDTDRPLIVQFCANNPEYLLKAAKLVEDHCEAVDINLGCPQDIARRGHYGSFLQDEWELIHDMINILHKNLSVPVTAKFRVFPDIGKTVEYAKMLERAGAQIITCHGRTREQRGQNTGLASYAHIAAVKAAVSIPVFANGNILFSSDISRCLSETGCDAVMTAEGVLYNPALFNGLPPSPSPSESTPTTLPLETTNPPSASLALEYLSIVRSQKTRTSPSAVKGHLFKFLRPALCRPRYHDLRDQIGKVRVNVPRTRGLEEGAWVWVDAYVKIVEEAKRRLEEDEREFTDGGRIRLEELVVRDGETGLDVLPHWIAQPYFRPIKEGGKEVGEKKKGGAGKGGDEAPSSDVPPTKSDQASVPSKRPPEDTVASSKKAKIDAKIDEEVVPGDVQA